MLTTCGDIEEILEDYDQRKPRRLLLETSGVLSLCETISIIFPWHLESPVHVTLAFVGSVFLNNDTKEARRLQRTVSRRLWVHKTILIIMSELTTIATHAASSLLSTNQVQCAVTRRTATPTPTLIIPLPLSMMRLRIQKNTATCTSNKLIIYV